MPGCAVVVMEREAVAAERLDFRGVYRTRCGAIVRILYWHAVLGKWVGKIVDASPWQQNLTWDEKGYAYVMGGLRDPEFDLMERVTGYPAEELKFGLLRGADGIQRV